MRVAELVGVRSFHLTETEIPPPGPGEVQVRIEAVGVCGSDLHSYAEGAVGDIPAWYPMVLGHEPAGVVVAAGSGVTGWSPGARVAVEPALYCYHCEFCLAGRHNICAKLRFMSQPDTPGFFRDRVNVPAHNLMELPDNLSTDEGTLIEPLAVVVHSMQFAAPRPGETAVVFGAGPIGLLTLGVLKTSGIGRVWVIEPVAHRRELARRLGADAVADPLVEDPVRVILRYTGRRGVDLAIDCAAKEGCPGQAIEVTRNGGRVVYTGIPSDVHVPLPFHPWRRKELAIFQVRRSNREDAVARDLLAAHPERFVPMLTHRRPLEEIGAAFAQLEHYADGVGKMLIRLA